MEIDDRDLRERFAELRAADGAVVRALAATLAREPRHRVRRVSRAALAIASTAVLVVAVALIRRDGRPAAIPISAWRPPSDVLLWSARSPVLGPMPPLGASVLDQYLHRPSR